MSIRKIKVRGVAQSPVAAVQSPEDVLTLKASYLVGGAAAMLTRSDGAAPEHEEDLTADKLVELVFEDETRWFCNADTLEEVFPEATAASRSADGTFRVPPVLRSTGAERGVVGDIALKALNIFTKKPLGEEVKRIAADLERKQLENYSGLYRLDADFRFAEFRPEPTDAPFLLFLHGTASSTRGSFGELLNTPVWSYIRQTYGNRVLALQHETLTKSPLENALELVRALPRYVTLHLISHSRGGLVGDILARLGNPNEHNRGFDETETAYLRKAGRQADLDRIAALKAELQNRKIKVGKFIRVACPAGGTILASRRLDNFFNVACNLIGYGTGLAASPVYSAFKNLIAAVIDCKNEADVLPGLEAMSPESAFIKVLNSPVSGVVPDSPLAVVSGNCTVRPGLKALVVIASKLFYLKDNDLVVNTRSMYQGTKREKDIQYFFDDTAGTDHFHYFKNGRTTGAILQALRADGAAAIPGFTSLLPGTLPEADRNAVLKLEGGQVFTDTVTGTRPIVVLLPGIMGSNLSTPDGLLWINYLRLVGGALTRLALGEPGVDIKAPSLISTSYKKLVDYLSETYDVVTFPFDWRLSLADAAAAFNARIGELLGHRQPIKIIAHSMGGVLVRDFILNHGNTWQKLNGSRDFRLVFLGAPLRGSFRIPAVLLGEDVIIDKLSRIDLFHTKAELLAVFRQFPGLLSLLPLTEGGPDDFAKETTWRGMREAHGEQGEDHWLLSSATARKAFGQYQKEVNRNLEAIDFSNTVYIAGRDKATPCGYRIDTVNAGGPNERKELVFLSTAEGDQSVTWESGIPKKLVAAQAVYYANVTHGSLANAPELFGGIADLLATGATHALSKRRPVVRGDEKVFRTPVQHDFDLSPEGVVGTLLGLGETAAPGVTDGAALRVSVSNGDLRYASYPVLAGHFHGDGILYAEKEIDYNLGRALTERHRLGLYPGEVGSNEIFVPDDQAFKGAIIVGLGPAGALTPFQLAQTVEQGVARYLLNLNSKVLYRNYPAGNAETIGLSAVIIGSGYGGLTVDSAVRAVIQGVLHANDKVKKLLEGAARTIASLEFVEQYEDMALNCLYSLARIESEETRSLRVRTDGTKIKTLLGSKKRLSAEAADDWWNRITVQEVNRLELPAEVRCLLFSASTGGAREEQRELYSSTALVEQLVEDLSGNNRWSPELAKTVFELLIPNDFKSQLKKHGNISWILDKQTAAYPWELLQDNAGGARPLCVNAGMIRQLATQDFRLKIDAVAKFNALVVGEPDLKGFLTPLPGALREGQRVWEMLAQNGYQTTVRLKSTAPEIIRALFQEDYKVIHLAGHGIFDRHSPANAGMVIGPNVYLTTREIGQMSTVPELVFVNCCYLGKTDAAAEAFYRSRYKMAANIGTQLIENGVKAVVVAGWAVDDAAALLFTEKFYECMFEGASFGDAVLRARTAVYEQYGNANNTWGAYQCYGNQYYKFRSSESSSKPVKVDFVIAEQAEIELNNLHNELETDRYSYGEYLKRLEAVSEAVDRAGIRNAVITAKEAYIYTDLGEYDRAIDKFAGLLKTEKATFPVATLEKYCNVRAKKWAADLLKPDAKPEELVNRMDEVIRDLQNLLSMGATAERYNLLGSAYKRKALLSGAKTAKDPDEHPKTDERPKADAYAEAASYYRQAYDLQARPYALTNWYTLESILVLLGRHQWGGEVAGKNGEAYRLPTREEALKQLDEAGEALAALSGAMDYWDMVSEANIRLCTLVMNAAAPDQKAWDEVLALYRKLWKKAGPRGKKLAEVEHLASLQDALSLLGDARAGTLTAEVGQLKAELERML